MRTARLAGLITAGALVLTVALPASASNHAMVRVLHGSPDAPSVDVFVDGDKVAALSGAEFGDLSEYVEVPGGTYEISVCATEDSSVCPIGPVELTFDGGRKYTIAASDALADIKADVFRDGNAVDDQARVRVVHLSADTPEVDVLTQDGSATIVDALPYRDATGYLELDAGDYDLKVCADADNSVCPLDPDSLALDAGVAYSVYAIGSLEGESLTAVVAVDGMAAPATDTEAPASNGWLLVLAGAGLLGLVASRRLLATRVRAG